jgi:hypothetical protein
MLSVGNLLDIGNIIFFIANFPQLITAYKNRRNLVGLSAKLLVGYIIASIFFIWAGIQTGGYACVVLNLINEGIYMIQLYWKQKYKLTKKLSLDEAGWHEVDS